MSVHTYSKCWLSQKFGVQKIDGGSKFFTSKMSWIFKLGEWEVLHVDLIKQHSLRHSDRKHIKGV